MPFVFALKALLRLRELQEGAELQALQAIAAQAAAVRAEIEAIENASEEQQRNIFRHSLDGIYGADLQLHVRRQEVVRERRDQLHQELKGLEKAREEQQAIHMRARRERETLSTLREKQLATYDEEQARWVQRQLDDLFLVRYVRERSISRKE